MERLSSESSGDANESKLSKPKEYPLDPGLLYSGGRFTVHECGIWRNGLIEDGIRNGLGMELPEAILVGKGIEPFTVGMA